jgi:polysaccharide biosynthesis/export protein
MEHMNILSVGLIVCALSFAGCASTTANGEATPAGGARTSQFCLSPLPDNTDSTNQSHYVIQPGDQLAISFYLSPEFDRKEITVRPDGDINLAFAGEVAAAGRTPEDLAAAIDKAYLSELRDPQASVLVTSMPGRVIYVEGQVTKPGELPMHAGMTLMEAVAGAGGLTPEAGPKQVIVARRDSCGNLDEEKVDLNPLLKGTAGADDMALLPADVIYIPRSGVANADLAIKQYVRDLLPIEPYLSLSPIP